MARPLVGSKLGFNSTDVPPHISQRNLRESGIRETGHLRSRASFASGGTEAARSGFEEFWSWTRWSAPPSLCYRRQGQ